MIFPIAHSGYRVRVRDGLLIDEHGAEAAGLRDWPRHIVWLAGDKQMPVQRRPETLVHELWHFWKLEFGKPADEESEANLVASFTLWFWKHLERQGGTAALMRLRPEGMVDQAADVEEPAATREPSCPKCNGYLELPTRNGRPTFADRLKRLMMWRHGDCEHCCHTVSWPESCTTAGVPTGHILGEFALSPLGRAVPSA